MAKAKTKTEAASSATGFEALSAENREWMKSFEEKGWMFFFTDSEWSASKGTAEDGHAALGPFASFMAMMNMVEKAQRAEDGLEVVDSDIKGNVYLPGTEPLSVPFLDSLARRRINLVREFKTASQAVSEINQDILNAYNDDRYRQHFVLDEASGKHEYKAAGGGGLRINHKTVDKVESFDEETEE